MFYENRKFLITSYTEIDGNLWFVIKNKKTDYTTKIQVQDIDYHRGIDPVIRGYAFLDVQEFFDRAKKTRKFMEKYGLYVEDLQRLLFEERYDREGYEMEFNRIRVSTSSIEFLYPGSPPMGYNIHVEYPIIDTYYIDDIIKKWFEDDLSQKEIKKLSTYVKRHIAPETEKILGKMIHRNVEEPLSIITEELRKGLLQEYF